MKPQVFRTAVSYRLGAPVVATEISCPLCMQTFDKLGDHASCCEKNGDTVNRHNRVRNLVARFCDEAFLLPLLNFGTFFRTLDIDPGCNNP